METDGRLPSGQPLAAAIEQVDEETAAAPAYYMINCAHPTHFGDALAGQEPWRERIRGLRANASTKSHAELDEASELDAGDPADLAARCAALRERLPRLNVLGGYCGTTATSRRSGTRGSRAAAGAIDSPGEPSRSLWLRRPSSCCLRSPPGSCSRARTCWP